MSAPKRQTITPVDGSVYVERTLATDDEIRSLVAAGWELAFHGVDHTPQTRLVDQVDGPDKLARAYQAGIEEIRHSVPICIGGRSTGVGSVHEDFLPVGEASPLGLGDG